MTLPELAAALEPIADGALASSNADVQKASIVLAALMGCIAGNETDTEALDVLAITAGQICEHQSSKYAICTCLSISRDPLCVHHGDIDKVSLPASPPEPFIAN